MLELLSITFRLYNPFDTGGTPVCDGIFEYIYNITVRVVPRNISYENYLFLL